LLERAAQSRQHSETLKALGVRSYMAVPLAHRGDSLGVITFAITASPRTYGDTDLALAVDLGRRAAIALQNARMMRALRDADRAKDLFLATLAHELRNPLAPIRNGLSILQHVPSEPARVEEVTAMMERQAALLARLVDDLLDVSRIATGKLEIKQEPVNLAEVLSTAVEMSRPHIEAAEHELNQTISSEPAWVLGDAGRLAQVFSNLLNNAGSSARAGRSCA
jgi:signal transduction histidine kinase